MEVKKCLNCQKEVEQVKGKRDRLYCDQNCKAAYFRKTKPKEKKYVQVDTYKKLLDENIELKRKLIEAKIPEEDKKTEEPKPPEPPIEDNLAKSDRIAKIEMMLSLSSKLMPHSKRVILEKELADLKFK